MAANIVANGGRRRSMDIHVHVNNTLDTVSTSGIFQLEVDDTLSIELLENEKTNCGANMCHFDGYLLYESL